MLFLPKWRVCFKPINQKRRGLKRVCPVPRGRADNDHGFAHRNAPNPVHNGRAKQCPAGKGFID
jgi:hypothetical protein